MYNIFGQFILRHLLIFKEVRIRERRIINLTYQSSFGFDKGSVLAVHFVVESAGVAQIVSRAVPTP